MPRLRDGHFFLEISAATTEHFDEEAAASDCGGAVVRFEPPHVGAWCSYDPALLDAEGSITHIAWLWHAGILYRLQIDASQLDEDAPRKIFTSFRPIP